MSAAELQAARILQTAERVMTPRQHQVWKMRVIRRLTFGQIGSALGIERSTAHDHYRKAQLELAAAIEDEREAA